MRPLTLEVRGFTVLTDVRLDLRGTDGLIALVGPNGAGKTSLLECLGPAALFREFPSRGMGLKDCAVARDARMVLTLDHDGSTWEITHLVDPTANGGRGKAEAFLARDGVRLTTGRLPDFDEAISKYFPAQSWYYAAAYSPQNGRGNFADLAPTERRDLFAGLLGLERWQLLAEAARTRATTAIALAERQESVIAALSGSVATVERPDPAEVEKAESWVAGQRHRMAEAQESGSAAKARRAAILGETAAADQIDGRRAQEVAARLALAEAEQLAGRAAEVDDAIIEVARLHALDASHRSAVAARQQAIDDAFKANDGAVRRMRDAQVARDRAIATTRAAAEALDEAERIQKAMPAEIDETPLRAAVDAARAALQVAAVDAERATREEARARRELVEAESAAAELGAVPCGGETLAGVDCATCPLIARAAAAAPRLPALRSALQAAESAPRDPAPAALVEAVREAENALRDAGDLNRARGAQAVALARAETLGAGWEAAQQASDAAIKVAYEAASDEAETRGARVRAEAAPMPPPPDVSGLPAARSLAAQAQAVRDAVARLPLLRERLEDARRLVAEAESAAERREGSEIAALGAQYAAAIAAYKEADALATQGQAEVDALRAQEARAAEAERQAAAVAERIATARAEADAARARAATDELLARSLGRQGLQALEIDCAGPAVSEIVNDLLGACYGPRFRVELRTIREAEAGKKQKEVFDLIVYDGRCGYGREHGSLSGGERVIVDEAVKLGIALFRGRGRFGALYRDETDGRLDLANRRAYPEMLRRALERGGFGALLFVSHAEEAWSQADWRIEVESGSARLVAR